MNQKLFYIISAVIALVLIAISLVWPQGEGLPSPKPFGHALQLPDWYRMDRERTIRLAKQATDKAAQDKAQADAEAAKDKVPSASSSTSAP